jgi:Leucine-rich repeat (LRR) protein
MYALTSFESLTANNCDILSSFSYGFGSYHTLQYLDLSYCPSLSYIDCSYNSISYINLSGTPINFLYCDNNNLDTNSLTNLLISIDENGVTSGNVTLQNQLGGGCLDTTGQTYKTNLENKGWSVGADICP